MRKPHLEALPKRLAMASTGLESGHSTRRPVRQKELVKVPEDAVNALRKRDVHPKAAQSVSQKLPEAGKPVADSAEQKRAKLLDEFTEFSVASRHPKCAFRRGSSLRPLTETA